MKPSTEHWLLSTISKRLQRIAEGKELMAEDRALTLLGILKDVAGDVPSLDSLPLSTKEWLEAAINSRLVAMEEGRELAEEARIATLTEALAALRPAAAPGGAVERVETGAGLSGGPIVSTGTISLSTATQAAVARANTAVQPEDLADVATSGNYADLTNTPTIPEQFNPIQGANMLLTGTYPNITFSAVAGEEFTPVWGEVQGNLEDQTDLQEALNGKAPAVHTHTAADITSGTLANARISQSSVTQHQAALSIGWGQLTGLPAYATRWPSWGEVTGKPATFAPSAHTHSIANITGLQVTLDDKMERSIPALDPVGEVGDNGTNYGMVLQPFRIGKNSSVDAPAFFGTNTSPYLWMGSSGSSSQQGALLGVYASSVDSSRELAFRGRSGGGWSDWARVWHDGNFDPDSKAPVANPVFEGDLTVSTSLASGGVIVERRNQPFNSSIEYKTTEGSLWAGYGNNGAIGFSVGGSSNLTGTNTWFKAQEGAAYIWQGSTPREVYHEGNLSVSGFVQQPGGSWWTDVTSTASQDSVAIRFQTPSHTRYFGVGNDGTLRTSTSVVFSTGDLILTSGNTVPMADNGVARLNNSWDTITQSGVYYNTATSSAPTNHVRYSLLHMQQPGGQFGQLAIRSGADNFFIRRADSGAVGDWCELYHTGNFDPSNYVTTNSTQTGLSGNKTWTGNHTFTSSSNTDSLTVERTGGTPRNAYVTYSTNATTIYAGIANVNDTTWGIGTSSNLTSSNTPFQFDTSTGNMSVGGIVTATNLTATSDPRLKTNKKKVKARRELVEKLEYWSFEWEKDGTKGRSVMADKVQEIAPEHVHVADDEMGTLSVDKGALALEMVFALIDRLKEMDEETVHVVD